MRLLTFLLLSCAIISCTSKFSKTDSSYNSPSYYVNPFIGTGGHGHTYPGATLPFGMVQLSPDTRLEGWDGCSGYHYSDDYIYGFSHTHLSGTGVSDYGDILLMPTNQINFNNGSDGNVGYGSHFKHENEVASPGFYSVLLEDTNIEVALTVTPRAGMHRYKFPSSKSQIVILDLLHRDKVLDAKIEVISDTELQGYRFSDAWAKKQMLYYNIKTSHPFIDKMQSPPMQGMPGGRKIALEFDNPNNEEIFISVGISAVDEEGAKQNRETEIENKTFDELKKEAEASWNNQLQKIEIDTERVNDKINFYTALYHTMLAPNLYQDVDGRYRGMDLKIHQNSNFDYYTVFSLWDTYRAAHPLYTIIEQERTNDFINTFLAKYDEGGIMPIWDLAANYTGCMIGYHAVPVIADAYLKGINGFDTEKAFEAMKHSAMQDHLGLKSYKTYGFIPVEDESESVSKTLEYAYDDWTIAQMAKTLNKEVDVKLFTERAQAYKNVFDPESGFMRGRFRNTWFAPFDPYEVNFNYTEANAWQYSLYAPHDISGHIKLMGGKDKFLSHLNNLFSANTATSGRDQADITGLIGQYAHGNEPSHHMAYLYNFVNEPTKTQEKVSKILTSLYKNEPDGISGNEDCGQMSAWYVFSSLGFYPVTPGSNQYIIGSPLVNRATINLESGKQFTIEAKNNSITNKYIQSVKLNNEPLERSYLYHKEIMAGGVLEFEMGNKPSTWATKNENIPSTGIEDYLITPTPFIAEGNVAFKNETSVVLGNADKNAEIFFSLNNNDFKPYEQAIKITDETLLSTYAINNGIKSPMLTTQFYKIDPNLSIELKTEYANQYNGGGKNALIDGIRGARDFRTGAWQGYQDSDLVAIVDIGKFKAIDQISINFLRDQRSWIFYPNEVECFISENNVDFKKVGIEKLNAEVHAEDSEIRTVRFILDKQKARYLKLIAKNIGDLPEWHLGAPLNGKAWLFVDEIEIK